MDTYIISKENIDAFKAKEIKDANLIQDISKISSRALLKGDKLYIDSNFSSDIKREILKRLNLFVKKTTFDLNGKKIQLFTQNIFDIKSNIIRTTSGSVGKDELTLSTLETEKVAREAYEAASSTLLNVDNSSAFISSNIWRKVVTNINEDYPEINLMNLDIADFNIYFSTKKDSISTIIVDPYFANIVSKGIIQNGYKLIETTYLNDLANEAFCF